MRSKEIMSNAVHVFIAAVISVATGLVSGFFIPKIYSIENYALYKTFTLYLGYVGVVHLGFSDGILLRFAGYEQSDLPKKEIRGYIRIFAGWQLIISFILALVVFISTLSPFRKYCFYFVCLNITMVNGNNLLSFLNQATKKFKLDSRISLIQSCLSIIIASAVVIFDLQYFLPYLILITCVYFVVLVIRIIYNRDLIFGEAETLKMLLPGVKSFIKVGFFVMISQLMGELILGIDRVLIDNFMLQVDFAIYSFAVSLVGLFYSVLNSLSKIVYPYLAKAESDKLNIYYIVFCLIIFLVAGVVLNSFYVIEIIVENLLNQYNASVRILKVLYPTLLFKMMVSFIGTNYFKLLGMEKRFTITNLVVLAVAIATDAIAIVLFNDIFFIAIASLFTFVVWFLIMHFQLSKRLSLKFGDIVKIVISPLLITGLFFLSNLFGYMGVLIFNAVLVLIIILVYRFEIKSLYNQKNQTEVENK